MGMELGIDKKQLEALKALCERWSGDRVQLRFVICLALTVVGVFGVLNPLAGRVAAARAAHGKATKLLGQAEELAFWTDQIKRYEPRVAVADDIVEWQTYVLEKLSHTSAQLIALEPKATSSRSVYKLVEMELVAKGQSYEEFADFIDRLEHGERLVRIESVRVEKQQNNISLTCLLKGLVKPSAGKAATPAGAGEQPLQDPGIPAGTVDSPQSPAGPRADEAAENEDRASGGDHDAPGTTDDRADAAAAPR